MKCPHCGSENVNYISHTTTKGYRGGKACCGVLLWGWVGLLCGLCGSGKQNTKEYWICNNCGNKFQNSDVKKAEQKSNSNIENIITKVKTLTNDYKNEPKAQAEQPKATVENNVSTSSNAPEIKSNVAKHDVNVPTKMSPAKSSFEPKTKIERTSRYEGTLSTDELLNRAKIFIEDKDWRKACEYCQNALDVDAGCAEAYFIKFMAEYNISSAEQITVDCAEMAAQLGSLFVVEDYKKASRFGDDAFKEKLNLYNQQAIYNYAVNFLDKCQTAEEIDKAKIFFRRIPDYATFKDVKNKLEKCDKKRNILIYQKAANILDHAKSQYDCDEAEKLFESILDYDDSKQKAKECRDFKNRIIYDTAKNLLENAVKLSDFDDAQSNFLLIKSYKDSEKKAEECINSKNQFIYNSACELINAVSTDVNIDINIIKECLRISYNEKTDFKKAMQENMALAKIKMLKTAQEEFELIPEYSDSKDKAIECRDKIELIEKNYDSCIRQIRKISITIIGLVFSIIILVILFSGIFSSIKKTENDEITAHETTVTVHEDTSDVITESTKYSSTYETAEKIEENSESNTVVESNSDYDNFIFFENTYDSSTIDYIGTYGGWTYFSEVIDITSEYQLYLYGTVYICDVAIKRVNIETMECENLIQTCCVSSLYDTFTQYHIYDFIIGDDGKLIFNYDDPNSFRIVSYDEYLGKEGYYIDSYVLSYDINTNSISQLCNDISDSQYFYYNGWLFKRFASEDWKSLLIDTIHNETYEDSGNCWVKSYDGKYILLKNGDSLCVVNTISSEIVEYHNMVLDFSYIKDRGDYVYLLNDDGIVKYVLDMQKQSCSDSIPFDSIESFLPPESKVLGENNIGLIYKKDNYICLTSDYHNADFYNDRIFNLKNIIDNEKEIYMKYDTEFEFDKIFYYDFNVCGKWVIINTYVNSIDIYYANHYYLNSETGMCFNVPITNGTGQYSNASDYITKENENESENFEFSIGYVSIDSGVLNVRNEPSFDSDIIGKLENNSEVEIYDYYNGWYLIYYYNYDYDSSLYGYVKSDYIIT